MCEPTHSIVQFPDKDDHDNPTDTRIDAIQAPERTDASFWHKLKRRIGNWFHFSAMGFGHSEAIGKLTPTGWNMLPRDTKYEAQWWDRKVKLDGFYRGPAWDETFAMNAAKEYAGVVSIGNLHTLRQFLEMSMRKSERPRSYIEAFRQILKPGPGVDQFFNKIKKYVGSYEVHYRYRASYSNNGLMVSPSLLTGQDLDTAIKIMTGFTRKRNLLVPEWADDGKLWTPKEGT